ncbi:glycine zipper 2TM domain-containing protein [Methylopila musalis]|uniref:17 kDa surface antigen n=1 Tax=Methylopila musalis TaxID=1134781 RepID=A0ABW3ZC49_9HYPH
MLISKAAALAAVGVLSLGLVACGPGREGEGLGTVAGAVGGGLIGSTIGGGSGRVAATVIGAGLGGLVGNRIGAAIDDDARRRAYDAEYEALESGYEGRPYEWRSDRYRGEVVVGPRYSRADYERCRSYTRRIYLDDGRVITERGQTCRGPRGRWVEVG